MIEKTFQMVIERNLIEEIEVRASIPSKGKPAINNKANPVWTINIRMIDGHVETLESSRGGPREWASLDRLNGWLTKRGIENYRIFKTPLIENRQQIINFLPQS